MFGVVLFLALQTSTEMSSPSFPVNVRGVAKIERGIKLYRFRASGGVPDTSTRCVSVYFAKPQRFTKKLLHMNGKSVLIRGTALNYFAMAAEDPVAATISRFQNECGNKFIIIIKSIKLLR